MGKNTVTETSKTPLAYDLYCGKGGWTHGLIAAGWRCIGYDIADMGGYPGELRIADVLTLNGSDLADADLIVASPPCQFFSYTAMPWTRAKKLAAEVRCCFGKRWRELRLFQACFRVQREASAAAGRHVPLVVENVCGAQTWVGRASWHYGSFYLWGDVPALMPSARTARKVAGFRFDGPGMSFQSAAVKNTGGSWFGVKDGLRTARNDPRDVRMTENGWGVKQGGEWWHDPTSYTRLTSSRSSARKEAQARIAMIPFELARWIGNVYFPHDW